MFMRFFCALGQVEENTVAVSRMFGPKGGRAHGVQQLVFNFVHFLLETIWRVVLTESGSPELLDSPRTSPEVPQTSPEVSPFLWKA